MFELERLKRGFFMFEINRCHLFFYLKNDVIEPDDFTFDAFYALYHKICPRNDIEELFQSMCVNDYFSFFPLYFIRHTESVFSYFCSTQGKAETINLDQLITFLNEKQRDPTLNEILYPFYDEKRAQEIINDYEQNEEAKTKSKQLGDFFQVLLFFEEYLKKTDKEVS